MCADSRYATQSPQVLVKTPQRIYAEAPAAHPPRNEVREVLSSCHCKKSPLSAYPTPATDYQAFSAKLSARYPPIILHHIRNQGLRKSDRYGQKSLKAPDENLKAPDKNLKAPDKNLKAPDKSPKAPDKKSQRGRTSTTLLNNANGKAA